MKFDLGFGNSVAVRKAFTDTYNGNLIVFSANKLMSLDYPKYEGDAELIEITRQVMKRQNGIEKKYVFLTNGATGAITIVLRAYRQRGFQYCHTRNAPWYINYPSIINAAGLSHADEDDHFFIDKSVVLMDIPSNPLGLMSHISEQMPYKIILDGAYWSNPYISNNFIPVPKHDVFVGSYSKILGLSGSRIGWLATDDDLLAERIKDLVIGEYCGISVPSMEIIKNSLFEFNWDNFEFMARNYLDDNREQFSKLEKFFGNTKVPSVGMFSYMPIDAKCKELLDKSGIHWTKGSDLGTNDGFGRFNIGQDPMIIRRAITTVLKNDKI